MPRVLVVDDDEGTIHFLQQSLASSGYEVSCGEAAARLLDSGAFDVILSDISMPGIDAIGLLRAVRERDLDVPVVLLTGGPNLETAIQAVEYGAFRYLLKPVGLTELQDVVRKAVQFHQLARIRKQAVSLLESGAGEPADRAALDASFASAVDELWIAYQPIISVSTRVLFAYEAFVRSRDAILSHPLVLLEAAERLGFVHRLGRVIRERVAEGAVRVAAGPLLFVNIHPQDLEDEGLYSPTAPLAQHARRVVLEVTERASLDRISDLSGRVEALRSIGYRLAVDDLGAGYAGLTSFVQLNSEIVKIDMSLVRGIDRDTARQELVRSMLEVCRDMAVRVVCEGVETRVERDTLVGLGADLLQGYLFGVPADVFLEVPPQAFVHFLLARRWLRNQV
jgi:EAL domain-containing protein (putative c-di-GMP-specific phosphodiesterase class I)